MIKSSSPSVAIINRNYPPRQGITGQSAAELAMFLERERGADVSIVATQGNYAGGSQAVDSAGNVIEIASLYDGKNKILRLFSSFIESFRLVRKAKSLKTDQIIVMTDPPFLSFWASMLLKKREWALWSMDLYPDAFVAAGLAKDTNPIYRWLKHCVYQNAPSFLIALGPLQAEHLFEQYKQKVRTAILPCGVYESRESRNLPAWKTENSEKILFGYCGNLGDAHSPEFVMEVINGLDPSRHHLVLSTYGSKSQAVLELAEERSDLVTIVSDGVPREHLGHIDVHLVSLLGHWSHVCVPSKAVSSVCAGSSFLFYGVPDCDNWHMLDESGWLVEECVSPAIRKQQIRLQISRITPQSILKKKEAAKANRLKLEQRTEVGMQEIGDYLCGVRTEETKSAKPNSKSQSSPKPVPSPSSGSNLSSRPKVNA